MTAASDIESSAAYAGIQRQVGLCSSGGDSTSSTPTWCSDTGLVSNLNSSLDNLFAKVQANADNKFVEVFSWTYSNGMYDTSPLAELSATSTEADAFQLWSYGFLSVQPSNATSATAAS